MRNQSKKSQSRANDKIKPQREQSKRTPHYSDKKPASIKENPKKQTDEPVRKSKTYGNKNIKPATPSANRYKRGNQISDSEPKKAYPKKGFRTGKQDAGKSTLPKQPKANSRKSVKKNDIQPPEKSSVRLNKYIAHSGMCSRREADKLIESGAVKINNVIVTELGTKVMLGQTVHIGDQLVKTEKPRYVLLNKPKNCITTSNDPYKRNTVVQLVADACRERIYPVGRLDRNTTGLLLLTNDGDLTRRLTHPRFGVRKIYDAVLDKPLQKADFEEISKGVELDGEIVVVDEIAYVEYDQNKRHIGIELHSGQNRVVRRIFEKFGYKVVKLDRVMFGSLTKKNLQRGRWRHLTDLEISILKRL